MQQLCSKSAMELSKDVSIDAGLTEVQNNTQQEKMMMMTLTTEFIKYSKNQSEKEQSFEAFKRT